MNNPYQTPANAQHQPATGGMVNCRGCGKEIHFSAASCPSCGARQRSRGYKSKVGAALLALFTGGFGIHRFYLGQWWGIFYLLFFWTFIPGLVSFIEFIVFLATNQESWDNQYNEGKPKAAGESGAGIIAVIIVVVMFVGTAFLGILAAIAIPAYQDYTLRAEVAMAMGDVAPIKQAYIDYARTHQQAPSNNQSLGLALPHKTQKGHDVIVTQDGVEILFSQQRQPLAGHSIILVPEVSDERVYWNCAGGDLPRKFRPAQCRQ